MITSAFESLVTVAIIVLAINQIPVLVSSLTGGVGISAFTVSSSSFAKMGAAAKRALFGKKSQEELGRGRKGLVNGSADLAKRSWNAWKNRDSGTAKSAK